jgi:hypothetical protein
MVPPRPARLLIAVLALGAGPAAAQSEFIRGDCNADGATGCQITDPIFLLLVLHAGLGQPPCLEACNSNDDGQVDISDAVYQLNFCFLGGTAPPPPMGACGADPTPSVSCEAFPPCSISCAPQDAMGVGPCDAIVGIFWDGFRCTWHSGCNCEGEDCDESFDSVEACYEAHAGCASACDPMDAAGAGDCERALGVVWTGRDCRSISGCECAGEDCDRIYKSFDECLASVTGCPATCGPMDVAEVGTCEPVHGWFWNGSECRVLSGCECAGEDCGRLFPDPEACAAAHAACK